MTTKRLPRPLKLAMLAVIATVIALVLVEIVLRMLPAAKPLGELSYETMDGQKVAQLAQGIELGFVVPVPTNHSPRPRYTWAPGHSFYLCYSDHEVLQKDWMDAQGRVLVHINQYGLRERDEITTNKPARERRIVCIGDSFTFGWGVPVEKGWVRMLEDELREDGKNVRTVNCGAAGALVVDEYQWALQQRFAKFEPDAVIVTICLNDLIPCSGLFVQGPAPDTGSKLLDRVLGAAGHTPLELDPTIDWVDLLLGLPEDQAVEGGLAGPNNPYEAMWSQGSPQRALAAMKAWCDNRNISLMVVLWPFLQGLGPGRFYPFEKLHQMVAAECEKLSIPFHDVLSALRSTPSEELWVTPADMHANPLAHRLALPGVVDLVRKH